MFCLGLAQPRRNHRNRAFGEVLVFVIVKFLAGNNLAHHARLGRVIAQHRNLELARLGLFSSYALLHHQLAVVPGGQIERHREFLAVMRFADAHRRAQVRRLYKHRIGERRLNLRDGLAGRAFPLRPQQRHMLHNQQPGIGKEPLHHVLVHPRRRAQHARADIRDPRQLKEPLDGSILSKGPVQHRKNHVQRLPAQRRMAIQSRNFAVSQLRRRRSRFRRQQRRLSLGQHLRSGSSRRIARTQFFPSLGNIRCRCLRPFRHTWRQLFPPRPLQQPLRRTRGQPMTGLVDADRHHLELPPVNRFQNRSRREQRNLMLPAPSAKQNSHPQFFCHCFFDHRTGR